MGQRRAGLAIASEVDGHALKLGVTLFFSLGEDGLIVDSAEDSTITALYSRERTVPQYSNELSRLNRPLLRRKETHRHCE